LAIIGLTREVKVATSTVQASLEHALVYSLEWMIRPLGAVKYLDPKETAPELSINAISVVLPHIHVYLDLIISCVGSAVPFELRFGVVSV
jgi:hypothetical protein